MYFEKEITKRLASQSKLVGAGWKVDVVRINEWPDVISGFRILEFSSAKYETMIVDS